MDLWRWRAVCQRSCGSACIGEERTRSMAEAASASRHDKHPNGPSLSQVRSFPAGTDVGNTAVAVGGYTGIDTTTSVEINVTGGGCVSPTPTPTSPTPTATATFTPTRTVTAT